jgi:glycosyltransferase involved in cell wall biosynthesis
MNPLVSICIPTYRQTFLLKENLESICVQTYQSIEVIISDDSPNDAVGKLVQSFQHRLPIQYFKNQLSLGSPANWNAVLKKAKGEFILLLHHDDQFSDKESLTNFLQPFLTKKSVDFVFGRNESIEKLSKGKAFSASYFARYYKDPSLLIPLNTLGAPSNVLIRNTMLELYDERFKWIVDIEYYTRLFKAGKGFAYIDKPLVKTGTHEGQVTNECINDPTILLLENITFAIENIPRLKSITVFDFYWRLLRNNSVRTIEDISSIGIEKNRIPFFIKKIVTIQGKTPAKLLEKGPVSKLLMAVTYLSLT